jgi:hypothetical protein
MNLFQRIRRHVNNALALRRKHETIDLWLDDMRPAPLGWVHAINVEEARYYYIRHKVRNLALDHDLGEKETGYDFVVFIVSCADWPKPAGYGTKRGWPEERPFMLTANPVGRDNMQQLIDRYGPYKKYRPI